MQKTFSLRLRLFVVLAGLGLLSCDPWFSYSAYDTRVGETYNGVGAGNLAQIQTLNAGDSKTFRVALISDTHYHFSKTRDAIDDINRRGNFDFVIVAGDITDNGLKQEFVFFHDLMSALTVPYIAVIGNHDYLSNGEEIYEQMYGSTNFTFVYNNVKFVIFDNTSIESGKDPDFEWLNSELRNEGGYDRIIPVSHIPPFDVQMDDFRESFHELMVANGIGLSIHGHSHDYSLSELYGDGVLYHTVSSPQNRAYTEMIVTPVDIEIRNVEY